MSDYRTRLLGFGIRGDRTHHTTRVEAEGGGTAGLVTEHHDGHTDVTVFPQSVNLAGKEQ